MNSGRPSHYQFNSLQAFWPALQVLSGEVEEAEATLESFFGIWKKFGALPERFLLNSNMAHSTEKYYPLRPELIESTYYLYMATDDHKYLHVSRISFEFLCHSSKFPPPSCSQMGAQMLDALNALTKVEHGFASMRDVENGKLEDRMTSFFLSETCK